MRRRSTSMLAGLTLGRVVSAGLVGATSSGVYAGVVSSARLQPLGDDAQPGGDAAEGVQAAHLGLAELALASIS
jgi:hypothetical protein